MAGASRHSPDKNKYGIDSDSTKNQDWAQQSKKRSKYIHAHHQDSIKIISNSLHSIPLLYHVVTKAQSLYRNSSLADVWKELKFFRWTIFHTFILSIGIDLLGNSGSRIRRNEEISWWTSRWAKFACTPYQTIFAKTTKAKKKKGGRAPHPSTGKPKRSNLSIYTV